MRNPRNLRTLRQSVAGGRWFAAAVAVVGLSAARSPAAVSVYEGFNYPAASLVNGQTGGAGFSGAWSEDNFAPPPDGFNDTVRDTVRSGSLTSGSLATTGGSAQMRGNFDQLSRALGTTFGANGTTTWVSFEIRQDAAGTDPTNLGADYGGMFLGFNLFVGKPDSTNLYSLEKFGGGGTVNSATANVLGTTAFLVTQITAAAGNDTVRLYVNPPPGATPPAAASATKSDLDVGTITTIGFAAGADATWTVDEVRIGSTFADVAPVPEPAAASLAGLAGLSLLGRRRRSPQSPRSPDPKSEI